ncbi:MAG: hypothetical protein ACREK5_06425 [Gemmatimonadota bacterium]
MATGTIGLAKDIEATRARIAQLKAEAAAEENRLADLRGVETVQLANQVAVYEKMTPEERVRLREESPSSFAAIMDAKREAGEARLFGEA